MNNQNYLVPPYYNSYYIQEQNQLQNQLQNELQIELQNRLQNELNNSIPQCEYKNNEAQKKNEIDKVSIQPPAVDTKVVFTNQKEDITIPMILFITGFFFHVSWILLFCMFRKSNDKTIRKLAKSAGIVFFIFICFPVLGILLTFSSYIFLYIYSMLKLSNIDN
jgi:hypothetical protein